jgi:hypothetical protein
VLEKGRFELVHLRGIRFGFPGNVAWLLIPPLLARINTEGKLAACPIRRGLQGLLSPHIAFNSRDLLVESPTENFTALTSSGHSRFALYVLC